MGIKGGLSFLLNFFIRIYLFFSAISFLRSAIPILSSTIFYTLSTGASFCGFSSYPKPSYEYRNEPLTKVLIDVIFG